MKKITALILIMILLCLTACSSDTATSTDSSNTDNSSTDAEPLPIYTSVDYVPEASGTEAYASDYMNIDSSNSDQGYIMIQYLGTHTKSIKFQISGPDGLTYTYDLTVDADYQVIPLTGGSGEYTLNTYEELDGSEYYVVDSTSITATIEDDTLTYLYPNQFVDFADGDSVVALSAEAAEDTYSELDVISNVYNAVMDTLEYDEAKMQTVLEGGLTGYIPDLDSVIESEVGICFDYAALMVSMLRIQHIPAKLVIGYAGESYHAWISVYTQEDGWVDDIIFFDGTSWSLVDPTLADNNDNASIEAFIGDGSTYTEKYVY